MNLSIFIYIRTESGFAGFTQLATGRERLRPPEGRITDAYLAGACVQPMQRAGKHDSPGPDDAVGLQPSGADIELPHRRDAERERQRGKFSGLRVDEGVLQRWRRQRDGALQHQPGDQEDGKVDISYTNVRCINYNTGGCTQVLGDYVGDLLLSTTLRVTDLNSAGAGAQRWSICRSK